jgi:hypothetical protein
MIIKFKRYENWIYQDNIFQVTKQVLDIEEMIALYDKSILDGRRDKDFLGDCNSASELAVHKVFYGAQDKVGPIYSTTFLLDKEQLNLSTTVAIFLIYNDQTRNEILITNQPVYLLNDEGKTIERLA